MKSKKSAESVESAQSAGSKGYGHWTWNKDGNKNRKKAEGELAEDKEKERVFGDAVLVDIDGVLADAQHRQHFLGKTPYRRKAQPEDRAEKKQEGRLENKAENEQEEYIKGGQGNHTKSKTSKNYQADNAEYSDNLKWEDTVTGTLNINSATGIESDALKKPKRDWKKFFAACTDDPPIQNMVELLNWLDPNLKIVLLTSRPHWVYEETLEWLSCNAVCWDLLVMRTQEIDKQNTSAQVFKAEAVKNLIGSGFNFILGFEDDPKNIATFNDPTKVGTAVIPCIYVHSGYYES